MVALLKVGGAKKLEHEGRRRGGRSLRGHGGGAKLWVRSGAVRARGEQLAACLASDQSHIGNHPASLPLSAAVCPTLANMALSFVLVLALAIFAKGTVPFLPLQSCVPQPHNATSGRKPMMPCAAPDRNA